MDGCSLGIANGGMSGAFRGIDAMVLRKREVCWPYGAEGRGYFHAKWHGLAEDNSGKLDRLSRLTSQCEHIKSPKAARARLSSSIVQASVSSTSLSSPAISSSKLCLDRNIVDVLRERGLWDAVTNEEQLKQAASKPLTSPLRVYLGMDATAMSLHLGNLVGLIVLAWFQRCGHIPVALLGGATSRIGDPSGKSVERPMMDENTIELNLQGIANNVKTILRVGESATGTSNTREMAPAIVLNNYDWFRGVALLDFLRDVGRYARVGTMLAKESVKKRMETEEGLSYTEFTYQLLQGYDFVHLFREHNISVQIGGSDQWGNIIAGVDLIRRLLQREGAFGLTFPLLLKSDGSKFGKSESGAVWLAPSMLSPYKFYQHLFATPDADVIKFMKMLTFVELDEVAHLEASMSAPDYVPNTVQRRLAEEVTRFVHAEEGLQEAIRATEALAPGSQTQLDVAALEAIAQDIPSVTLPLSDILNKTVTDVVVSAGLFPSKGAAKRMVQQGGVYLNNAKVEGATVVVSESDILGGRMLLLASGKKNKLVVRIS